MKIASITPIWNAEQFIRPHFKMLSSLDENIVLLGKRPFGDYLAANIVTDKPDHSEEILRAEFPRVKIYTHDFDHLGGEIFNMGMDIARDLGCDAIIKLDPDMLLTEFDWDTLINHINSSYWGDVLMLDFKKCTFVYKVDFKHGVPCSIFPCGNDPLVVDINQRFIEDGVRIGATGHQTTLNWDNFMIHHFSGFKPYADKEELIRIENLPGFTGWTECPQEIQKMFQ